MLVNAEVFASENIDNELFTDFPVERIISRRVSIHYDDEYSNATVPWELINKLLWAANGISWSGRTVPSLSEFPIIIYVSNVTAVYKYLPENQNVALWREGDYRDLSAGYDAPIQLYIAYNKDLCPDENWANAESGCVTQNIYLMANALNLGTVCLGGPAIDRDYITDQLDLPENQKVLYKMPLGYPSPPFDYQNLIKDSVPSSTELPEIKESSLPFIQALEYVSSSHEWSENPVTKQQLSQVLWASYGYSYYKDTNTGHRPDHRTVPSAGARYPMKIYLANSSGVYEYVPTEHTLITKVSEDRRLNIATSSGNLWASSAPSIILMAWNDANILNIPTTYIEAGLIAQNIYLECSALGLVSDWGRADNDEEAIKEALGLLDKKNIHPVSIVTVGHPSTYFQKVEWDEIVYQVKMQTNSTIMNFAFSQANKKVSFDVSGNLGTNNFYNVTFPKSLMRGNYTVLVDGKPLAATTNTNSTHASLYFSFDASNNVNVEILTEKVIPEFQTWTFTLAFFVMLFFGYLCKRRFR